VVYSSRTWGSTIARQLRYSRLFRPGHSVVDDMVSLRNIEQLMKPLSDGLRSARNLFRRDGTDQAKHHIDIPTKTLILVPDMSPYALRWGLGKAGDEEAMQISGTLQGTNTSRYAIRAAGIKLLHPRDLVMLTRLVTIADPESRMHGTGNLIAPGRIGDLSFMFFVTPAITMPGMPLVATIAILDQFGNEHIIRDLEFKFIGPHKLP